IDLNATAAYKRAGYKSKGRAAENCASRPLGNAGVQARIAERMKEREKRTEITQDRVLLELSRLAFFDIRTIYNADGSLKNIVDLDDNAAAAMAGVDVVEMAGGAEISGGGVGHIAAFTKKAKVWDKKGALQLC